MVLIRSKLVALAAAALALASWSSPAKAWNCRGHMIVAAAAWNKISDPQVRQRLGQILERNPKAASWKANAGTLDPIEAMFLQAACWPDDIKQDGAYHDPDPKKHEPDPGHVTAEAYNDLWRHRGWHFKDIAFSPDGTPLMQAKTPNAQTQIEAFRATLASNENDDMKSYALAWLLHLVGDVHQPLHATSRFTASDLKGDGGANDVCLEGPPVNGRCPNLHSYWDDLFGSSRVASAANAYATAGGSRALPKPDAASVAKNQVSDWLVESEALAEQAVYVGPIANGLGPYDLRTGANGADLYHDHALAVARAQVSLAGARLGRLITQNLR